MPSKAGMMASKLAMLALVCGMRSTDRRLIPLNSYLSPRFF
jgi:hypothetical protein